MKAKWEYKLQYVDRDLPPLNMETMQADGWELVSVCVAETTNFGGLGGLHSPRTLLFAWKRPNGN